MGKMTETTMIRGALIMPYPSALGPAIPSLMSGASVLARELA